MKNIKTQGGYTLIETMVAISIFIIVALAGMSTLLNANVVHNKSQNMRSILDSLSFAMEDMSRNLRTGYNYRCILVNSDADSSVVATPKSGQNCWGIAFESADGDDTTLDGDPVDNNDQWVYFIDGGLKKIFKSTLGPYYSGGAFIAGNFVVLTPDDGQNKIVIDTNASHFEVLGAEPPIWPSSGNRQQPFIIIKLVGTITYKNVVTPFSLQTSVSQRLIDV